MANNKPRNALHRNQRAAQASAAAVAQVNQLAGDVRSVRADVSTVQIDVGGVQKDLGVARTDVSKLQSQLPDVTQRLKTVEVVTGVVEGSPVKLDRLRAVTGVGPATEAALRRLGIDTPQKLVARTSTTQAKAQLSQQLKSLGQSQGTDVADIEGWLQQI